MRTNIVIDGALAERARRLTGLETKKAVDVVGQRVRDDAVGAVEDGRERRLRQRQAAVGPRHDRFVRPHAAPRGPLEEEGRGAPAPPAG